MPLISFIIPYHNEPIWMLRDCLESIMAIGIERDEYEIILIDDGSDTSPVKELGDFKDRIKYVRQDNGGLSSARNLGISIAKGEYLQFVDSDDHLIFHNYNQVIGLIREKKMDMLMFRFSKKELHYSTKNHRVVLGKGWRGDEYLCHNNLRAAACGYVFRRELLGELRFVEGILHEDDMFTPQIILKCNTLYDVNLPCYYYRQHQGTIMSKRTKDHLYRRFECHLLAIKHHYEMRNELTGTACQGMERCVNQMVMAYAYLIMILLRSPNEYRRLTNELRSISLYPLPLKAYTWKYYLFALLTRLY